MERDGIDTDFKDDQDDDNGVLFDGVYVWSIKCHKMSHLNGGIGIIDDIYHIINCNTLDQNHLDINDNNSIEYGNFYVYDQQGIIYNGSRNDNDIYCYCDEWNTGDIISVQINCNQWTIQFLRNGKFVAKSFKLPSCSVTKMFYPIAYSCACKGFHYETI